MKIASISFVIVAIFCFASVTCDTPNLIVTVSSEEFPMYLSSTIHVAIYQDLLFHPSFNESTATFRINVRRRNADGFYLLIKSPDIDVGNNYTPITNGKWLAMIGSDNTWIGLLNLDTGNISNITQISFGFSSGRFTDNNTIAFYNNDDASLTTIRYVNGDWIEIGPRFSLDSSYYASINPIASWPDNYFLTRAYDGSGKFNIFERLANSTWDLADTIANFGDYFSTGGVTLYNGNDTVISASGMWRNDGSVNRVGSLAIFKKTDNEWNLVQQFLLDDLGITSYEAVAGYGLVMLDDNTLLYGAPITSNSLPSGIVFVFQRNETGLWSVVQTFTTEAKIQFGYQIFTNDNDIVFTGFKSFNGNDNAAMLFSIPKCYNSSINVTCNDLELDVSECQFNTSTTSSLYTINNLQCGPVTSTINQTAVSDGQEILVEYSFSRYLVSASCTSRITCTQPPPTSVPVPTSPSSAKNVSGPTFFAVLLLLFLSYY